MRSAQGEMFHNGNRFEIEVRFQKRINIKSDIIRNFSCQTEIAFSTIYRHGKWSGDSRLLACSEYSSGSVVVPMTVPRQLSVAVSVEETSAEHSPLISGRSATSSAGAVVSLTVTVAMHSPKAPWLSVIVRTTSVTPKEYGPGGACSKVMGSPSGSKEPAPALGMVQAEPGQSRAYLRLQQLFFDFKEVITDSINYLFEFRCSELQNLAEKF